MLNPMAEVMQMSSSCHVHADSIFCCTLESLNHTVRPAGAALTAIYPKRLEVAMIILDARLSRITIISLPIVNFPIAALGRSTTPHFEPVLPLSPPRLVGLFAGRWDRSRGVKRVRDATEQASSANMLQPWGLSPAGNSCKPANHTSKISPVSRPRWYFISRGLTECTIESAKIRLLELIYRAVRDG